MLTIQTWRDPYDSGFSPTSPKEITLKPGLTVLVGCNGAGKTTLLHNIKAKAKKQNIPCHLYDNLKDGGSFSIGEALFSGEMEFTATLWSSSEGESIKLNFERVSTKFKRFLQDGFFDTKTNRLKRICDEYRGETKEVGQLTEKRILLFDAVDSGLSVDSIVEIKEVLTHVLQDAEKLGVELYLIISANEYELARNSTCFDVSTGKYITFADYEAYRTFILKSRSKKEKRIEKQTVWFEKRKQREEEALLRRKAKYEPLIAQIKEKAEKENRSLSMSEKNKIRQYEDIIKGER